ncbi:MAG: DUF4157 domain-containing protein [Rhodocyclaceae bacterium]
MSTAVATKTAAPTVQRAAQVNRATTMPAPVRVPSPPVTVQCAPAMKVSSPNDAAEKEAEDTAKRVMQMPAGIKRPSLADQPGGKSGGTKKIMRSAWQSPYVARMAGLIVQRESAIARMVAEATPRNLALVQRQKRSASTVNGQVDVSANLASEIRNARGGGSPLPPSVRRFMEPRFDADFSDVRVHTGDQAAGMSQELSAKAFTVGKDIFFGAGQFKPDTGEGKELLAHELTHTVQQGGAKQGAGQAAQRSVDDSVVHREPVAEGTVQRDLLPDPWDYVKEKADSLPGYPLFKVIIGYDPLNQTSVPRDAGNIMRGVISLLPGIGAKINQALDNHGIFAKVSAWVSTQFNAVKDVGKNIWNEVKQFIKNIGSKILGGLGSLWESGKAIITGPIDQVIGLAKTLGTGIVELIKDLILKPIGAYAQTTSGYKILCGIMGKDPITGDAASLDGEALMGAFMDFANQGETWATIKQAKAIPRTVAWFKQNTAILKQKVMAIPGLFLAALKSLTIYDIILIPLAFIKLGKAFANFAGDFISWAAKAAWDLLEIVFDVVKPGVMSYVKKTGGALKAILKNPAPFVGNLANAAKTGFNMFAGNFLNHLKAGLLDWLTGSLPGVYIPKSFALLELFKLGLSVLGLSWANIRIKLVKAIGEPAVAAAEETVSIVKTLMREGPAAAWAQIKDGLNNLTGMIVDGISGLVVDAIVKKAIPKVIAMFIPGAGFISAIMSIVDLAMTVYQKIQQIAAVANAIVGSIVQIAAGNIAAAAKKVESILAGILTLAINFLLNFAVGKIADKVMGVIRKVRDPVDKALDKAIGWLVGLVKKAVGKLTGKDKKDERTDAQKLADLNAAVNAAEALLEDKKMTPAAIRKKLPGLKKKHKLAALDLVEDATSAEGTTFHVHGEVNPKKNSKPKTKSKGKLVSSGVKARAVSSDIKDKLAPVTGDPAQYELGAMSVVMKDMLIPEWEQATGTPVVDINVKGTGDPKYPTPSSQSGARVKVQKGFAGPNPTRPEARVEFLKPKGKGQISHVFVVEATTVRDMTTSEHKVTQITSTVLSLIDKYGKDPKPQVTYHIVTPSDLTPAEEGMINGVLKMPGAEMIKVDYIKTG